MRQWSRCLSVCLSPDLFCSAVQGGAQCSGCSWGPLSCLSKVPFCDDGHSFFTSLHKSAGVLTLSCCLFPGLLPHLTFPCCLFPRAPQITDGPDPDQPLIAGMGASVKLLESKLRSAQAARRNVAMDPTIKVSIWRWWWAWVWMWVYLGVKDGDARLPVRV